MLVVSNRIESNLHSYQYHLIDLNDVFYMRERENNRIIIINSRFGSSYLSRSINNNNNYNETKRYEYNPEKGINNRYGEAEK